MSSQLIDPHMLQDVFGLTNTRVMSTSGRVILWDSVFGFIGDVDFDISNIPILDISNYPNIQSAVDEWVSILPG